MLPLPLNEFPHIPVGPGIIPQLEEVLVQRHRDGKVAAPFFATELFDQLPEAIEWFMKADITRHYLLNPDLVVLFEIYFVSFEKLTVRRFPGDPPTLPYPALSSPLLTYPIRRFFSP